MRQFRKRLGDMLVEAGLITDDQLNQALAEQKNSGLKLGDVLISQGYITEQQKIELLEFQLGIPHVQLHRQKIDEKVVRMIPDHLAKKYQVLPLRIESGKLIVAMSDPLDYYAIEELRMVTSFEVSPVISTKDELNRAIARYFGMQQNVDDVLNVIEEELEETNTDNDAPVVRLVNQTIAQAVTLGASDIHIDPQENGVKVRFRIDGVLRTEREYPASMLNVIVARLKILSNLNIAERRLPQDGRFEMDIDFRKIDIRISTLPTIHGEKTVLRILDVANMKKDIHELCFSVPNFGLFQQMLGAPHGIVLITGPTGSGKTTTLYSALNQLNREDVNIITVEDPVEYQLDGINQVQVNTGTGLTFAKGLRSILRQDPNIVMVGEIRDKETAEMAIRASLTGHLVLSTLHTNNAVSTISRLVDMGIEPFLVASSLRGIVAQRLVRKICPSCKSEIEVTPEITKLFESYSVPFSKLYSGKGCGNCNMTGYRGRMAIHEVAILDDLTRRLIVQGKDESEISASLKVNGYQSMFVDGLQKASQGQTTLSELLRVTME